MNVRRMERAKIFRGAIFLAAAALGLGCSLVGGSIPDSYRRQALDDLNAFLPPSKTPFLPVDATDTRPATASPTGRPPAETPEVMIRIVITGTETAAPTLTLTLTLFPSATARPYLSPTITKSKLPNVPATATPIPLVEVQITATPLSTLTFSPSATETPAPTEDPRSATPTETLTGSETATPTQTFTPPPTITPTATPAPTATSTPLPTAIPTAGPTTTGCATFNFDWEGQVAVLINAERAKYWKDALVLDSRLTSSARAHSIDMVVNKFMSHTGSDGSTPQQREQRAGYYGRYWGEIIGGGTPTIAVTWWMNEPGHRDMVLGTDWPYVDYGVGYAYCPGQGWFTVDFGAP
jgi:uncharacterized protein YkwD